MENIFLNPIALQPLSKEEYKIFSQSKNSHICCKHFSEEEYRVKDHCHCTGAFRGPAHQNCNLEYRKKYSIPVLFHNLSGYDSHFIIKALCSEIEGRLTLLPINKDRYISFTKFIKNCKINFCFLDSFRFMSSSLDKLASYLTSARF